MPREGQYPAFVRFKELAGRDVAFVEHGEGPTTLFLHGFPLDHRLWLDQVFELGRLGRHCVALDLPGFGRSDPLRAPVLTMDALADDVAAFLDGDPADVVALSMGGYVALALWERHPEVIRSLVLMDTRATADPEQGKASRRATAANVIDAGASSLVAPMTEALLAPRAEPWVKARLRTMIEATSVETIVAALEGMAIRPDRTGLLSTIDVPSLVVVGEYDRRIPVEQGEAMAAAIPGAGFLTITDAGHLPPIEQPGQVTRVLADFLAL